MLHDQTEIQNDALHALGSICIRHYNFMLESKLKHLYIDILTESFYPVTHKVKVFLITVLSYAIFASLYFYPLLVAPSSCLFKNGLTVRFFSLSGAQ